MGVGGNRGRPPATRARVLTYIRRYKPDTVAQIARVLQVDRSQVYRILKAIYGPDFRTCWKFPCRSYDAEKLTNLPGDTAERFADLVDTTQGYGPDGNCWHWTGRLDGSGYGAGILVNGKMVRATHLALALDGRVRESSLMLALHSCDNRQCVNPAHLRWGTDTENHEDRRERGTRGKHWLPDDVVHMIHQSDETNLALANRIGVTASCVCNIRRGLSHKHIFELYRHITLDKDVA